MNDQYLDRICGVCGKPFGWHQHTTDKCPVDDKREGVYQETFFINIEHMDNKRFREEATKKLADLQPKLINKNYLIDQIKDKMQGLDKAKHYSKWKAYAECLALIEDTNEHEITLKDI